ncbi:MAG: hypothetical protein L0216_04530 [Planctomycetales bacterium]|nr:hypothetical protein [Planctomycetales bacterium]
MARTLFGGILAVTAVLGAAAPAAMAGEAGTREGGAVKAFVGGEMNIEYVWRDAFFDALFPRNKVPNGVTRVRPEPETYMNLFTTVFVEFQLRDLWGAYVEIETVRDAFAGESHRLGDTNGQALKFGQAYVSASDFLFKGTDFRLGLQDLREELRPGRGHGAFFLDTARSENPFTGAVHTAAFVTQAKGPILGPVDDTIVATGVPTSVSGTPRTGLGTVGFPPPGVTIGSPLYGGIADPDPGQSDWGWNPYLGGNAWYNNLVGQSKTSDFGGLRANIEVWDRVFWLRGFAGSTLETGTARKDTQLFGGAIETRFKLPTGSRSGMSRFQVLYAVLSAHTDAFVQSFGASADLWIVSDYFEAYGEFVGQLGQYTERSRPFGFHDTQQKSYAWYAGGRFEIPLSLLGLTEQTSGNVFFLDCSYWYLSGDAGNPYQANEDYVSFESVDSALILEGAEHGLDVDTNYWAIKWEGGITADLFSCSIFYGMYRLNRPPFGTVGGQSPSNPNPIGQRLGNEIDLRLRWYPIPNVEIGVALAFLFDSNFFDSATRARAAQAGGPPADSAPNRTGDNAQLVIADVKFKF